MIYRTYGVYFTQKVEKTTDKSETEYLLSAKRRQGNDYEKIKKIISIATQFYT